LRLAIILSVAAAAVGLAACGSSTPDTGGGSTNSRGASAADASRALSFARCMRSHGVSNFPDPTGGKLQLQVQRTPGSTSVNGAEVNGRVFQSAMQACRSYLPNGGHVTAAQTAKVRAQALAMSRCMRSHGVPNFPDPQFQSGPGGGLGVGIRLNGSGIDPNSPAFQAAQRACGKLFGGAPMTAKAAG
jgi:hypothetical protein